MPNSGKPEVGAGEAQWCLREFESVRGVALANPSPNHGLRNHRAALSRKGSEPFGADQNIHYHANRLSETETTALAPGSRQRRSASVKFPTGVLSPAMPPEFVDELLGVSGQEPLRLPCDPQPAADSRAAL